MKTCTTEKEYINAIAVPVQRACKRYGYLPSVLIAQSCLENGYGIPSYWDNPEIKALMMCNNMVGIKSNLLNNSWDEYTVWKGDTIIKYTPEEYNGRVVTISDSFRAYDSIEQSFCDFLLFLTYASNEGKYGTPKYGKEVMSIKDPSRLIKEVASRGYATGSTYASNVMKIIHKHDLTIYDNLSGVNPSTYVPKILDVEVPDEELEPYTKKITNKKIHDITRENKSQVPRARGNNRIKFIVVHYLGVPNADNPYLYGGGYGGHYNIQRNGEIYKAADPNTAVVWHCGGGLQGSNGHSFYQVCTNYNSIGIECGVCYTENVKDASGDSDKWYFTEETQESLVYLVSKLMDDYGISIDHVIRHYDVTGKICPNPYVKNNHLRTSWTWNEFKSNLQQYRKDKTITLPFTPVETETKTEQKTTTTKKDYLAKGDSGNAVKTLQKMLNALNYNCGNVDGKFGTKTESALKAYQKAYKLSVTGKYDTKTKSSLETSYKNIDTSVWKAVGTATSTVNSLNVRCGPGTNCRVLRQLNKGNRFEVDGRVEGDWVHISVLGQIGWVHKKYVDYD